MNIKEIESVSKLDAFKRYQYFIKKIADYEELWTITDENGNYALSDVDKETFISLWPSKEYVASNLNDGWENCKPLKLSIEEFEKKLVPIISDEDYLINVFPVDGKSGFIVNLDEFIGDLNEELENYS